jgi:hypothetical protein
VEKPVDKYAELRAELEAIARARLIDCVDYAEGRVELRPVAELPPDALAAIAQIERGPGGVKVRLYDKLRAVELLLRLDGQWGEAPEENNLLEMLGEGFGDENGVSFEE